MARKLSPDSIDFAEYEASTENAQKVRKASDFFDGVRLQFQKTDSGKRHPGMGSTKAGRVLEFQPGSITLWAGFSGHRKSMFTSQVALDLCAAGKRVLMASMEMTPVETLERMARQASAHNRPSEAWLAGFEHWTDNRLWIFDHMGRVAPSQVIGLCRYFAEELRGSHVFIDSMMMVVGSEESMDEQKQFITDLVRVAQETQMHIHLVAHCRKPPNTGETLPPSKYDVRGAAAITDQVSNVVLVWFNKAKRAALERNPGDEEQLQKPDVCVVIDKQRHGSWEGKLSMWFDDRSLRFVDDRTSEVLPYELQGATE